MSETHDLDPQPAEHLHVDEAWKQQVAKERAEEERRAAEDAAAGRTAAETFPPASFATLVSMLATQAVIAMGQVPHPLTGKAEPHPEEARHFIDLLAILEEKTRRNLTGHEANLLNNVLHELRLAYVYASQNPPAGSPDASPEVATPESKIILP